MPPICGGIDVHQAQLTACVRRVDADGQVTPAVRACATTDDALGTFSWRGRAMRRRGTIACRTDRKERQQKRAVKALGRLGYHVTLERTVERPGASDLSPPAPLAARS